MICEKPTIPSGPREIAISGRIRPYASNRSSCPGSVSSRTETDMFPPFVMHVDVMRTANHSVPNWKMTNNVLSLMSLDLNAHLSPLV
ncbi:hypothetical protein N0V93_002526 [Gnomoniopsis smithogilvyi]|uniref:Uncharacterized protein n=1 Tax=Gnomoniopsis smithogilvyi TaxID=1191159 RepID=A0A9W8YXS3_9PEZI|nr:hypothetical protein N0V93_002526 [Gnomoniopsis smithogilvyi]